MKLKKLIASIAVSALAASLFVGCSSANANDTNDTTQIETENPADEAVIELATDVVVIGAGGGGLSAAVEAHDAGANVIVVEKMPFVGGNTARATGGINAAGTMFQEANGIEDDVETHFEDTMAGGDQKNDPELVKFMTENSADAVHWLSDLGADLTDVGFLGGSTNSRSHRPTGGAPVGDHLIEVLYQNTTERGIETLLNTEATSIIVEDNVVVGITAVDATGQEMIIRAESVIIAAGGFGNNSDLYVTYQPSLDGFVSTNQPGATGDGIVLAEAIGANLVDIEEIQIHPTVHADTAGLITEAVRGNGAILVNTTGERFINEMLTRDIVSAGILEQEGQTSYLIFDHTVRESLSAIEKYVEQGLVTEGETLAELAEVTGMDTDALEASVAQWNTTVETGVDEAFGRESGLTFAYTQAPYYALEVAPGVHHTMGGININTDAEVISTTGDVIEGLYAAGEVTGGVHGTERLGGNALADIIVFGRQAGINAAARAMADGEFIGAGEGSEASSEETATINPDAEAQFVDGVYTGTGKGNNAEIEVEVTVVDGFITNIEVLSHKETGSIFASIENDLIPAIIYSQSTESVDAISGATNSSDAVIEAIEAALAQ